MQPNALAWVYTAKIPGDRVRKTVPAWQLGWRRKWEVLLSSFFLIAVVFHASSKTAGKGLSSHSYPALVDTVVKDSSASPSESLEPDRLAGWLGRPVREIVFKGIEPERKQTLQNHLSQEVGAPLDREKIAQS